MAKRKAPRASRKPRARRGSKPRRAPAAAEPHAIVRDYTRELEAIAEATHAAILEALPAVRADDERSGPSLGPTRSFAGIILQLLRALEPRATQLALAFTRRAERFNRAAVRGSMEVAGLSPSQLSLLDKPDRRRLRAFVRANVALIKNLAEKHARRAEALVAESLKHGTTSERLAAQLQDELGIAKRRAALIADDQVHKLHANLTQLRHKRVGINRYIWRTSNDARVRSEHAARNGQVFSYDDPPEDGHPGEPIRCRCRAEPALQNPGL